MEQKYLTHPVTSGVGLIFTGQKNVDRIRVKHAKFYKFPTNTLIKCRAFSINFGKRPLAKIGKNDRLNIKIGRN